ncbi:hypothetical protein GCM10010273_30860 [Streptomyces lavendulocolor]
MGRNPSGNRSTGRCTANERAPRIDTRRTTPPANMSETRPCGRTADGTHGTEKSLADTP